MGYPVTHTLTAADLWEEFQKDNQAANAKFGGQYVQLSGKVRSVITDPRSALILETSSEPNGVECVFASKDEISSTKPGSQITIQGECHGRTKSDENLLLMICHLRKNK
jgi:hypothetical protein